MGEYLKKKFRVPGRTFHGNPQNHKNAHVQAKKKINVPGSILLKYAMHVILKWPQYCIFKIKFSWFSIIKSYWRRILRLGIRCVVKFGYDKNSSFSLNFDAISLHFFKNSSENHGQADSVALEHFRLTPGRQNSKNHQKSLFLYRSRSISTRF